MKTQVAVTALHHLIASISVTMRIQTTRQSERKIQKDLNKELLDYYY